MHGVIEASTYQKRTKTCASSRFNAVQSHGTVHGSCDLIMAAHAFVPLFVHTAAKRCVIMNQPATAVELAIRREARSARGRLGMPRAAGMPYAILRAGMLRHGRLMLHS
jgi:hypothetical protein